MNANKLIYNPIYINKINICNKENFNNNLIQCINKKTQTQYKEEINHFQ